MNYNDIPVKITVLLGQAIIDLKTAREIGEGSLLELNTKPSDSCIILFNGKSKWKGEVITIEDQFGIRFTDPIPEDKQQTYLDIEHFIPLVKIKES